VTGCQLDMVRMDTEEEYLPSAYDGRAVTIVLKICTSPWYGSS
jgi:hypothetical protein